MKELQLYFVGFYKHDGIQCLLSGPFVDYERADISWEKISYKKQNRDSFRIVHITVPISGLEILK